MKTQNKILKGAALAVCALVVSSATLHASSPAKQHEERGTIREVDMSHHQLVVTERHDNSIHRFQWNDRTEFLEHSKKVTPTALKAGERVWLTYAPIGDIPLVQKVRLAPAAKHASAHYRGTGRSS